MQMAKKRIRVYYYKKRLFESTRHAPSRLNDDVVPKEEMVSGLD